MVTLLTLRPPNRKHSPLTNLGEDLFHPLM